jgi:hypothetical protein
MKKTLLAIALLLTVCFSNAQTKVFKEVSEDISSQIKIIRQDNALVGYVVFTTLEKASADSFNYKITIMDENLNDIGTINFREQRLFLQAVTFEEDVLCLGYLKSNFIGYEFKNKREYKAAWPNAKSAVLVQFLSLDGKIIKSNTIKADIAHEKDPVYAYTSKIYGMGVLKFGIQLKNIPKKGFACFYGDDNKKSLITYTPAGNQIWQKPVKEDAQAFGLLTSGADIYLLLKKSQTDEGGYELLGYGIHDSTAFPKYTLKDKKGNSLKVLTFDNDPATGKPYLSGYIIDPEKGNNYFLPKQVAKGTYAGVFTININGHKKTDYNEVFSYWSDGSQSFISPRGRFTDNKSYVRYVESFKDYQGNTYFTGSSYIKKTKWGSIAGTVITAPLLVPPIWISFFGYSKFKAEDPIFLKQNPKGGITLENSLHANNSGFVMNKMPFSYMDRRSYYAVNNSDTKTNYVIVDDVKDIFVYNVNQKKVVRTIPHKDGNIQTNVYPAKEGHVMVSEYNKKEKYTRYSIESL